MAEVDAGLAASLKEAKKKTMAFAFVTNGTDGKLMVDKKKIPEKATAEAKKACGGKVVRGRCHDEEGTLVFEVGKPAPATFPSLVKKLVKRDAGLMLQAVEFRVAPDLAAEEAESDGQPSAPTAPPPLADDGPRQRWEKALAEVEPAYLQGLRDQPEKASTLRAVMGFAQGKAQKEDFPGAIAALRKLAENLARTPAGNGSQTTPTAPPPPPPDGARAAVLRRLNGLTPGVKAALAGPSAARVQALLGAVNGLIKNGAFAQAGKVLDELEPLLAAGAPAAGPAPAATAAEARATAAPVSNAVFTQARLAWDAARKKIQADLRKLEQAIVAAGPEQDEYDPDAMAMGARRLYGILDALDTRLIDTLDEALNAQTPGYRQTLQGVAGKLVKEYLAFVNSDPLMALVDDNGFAPVAVRKTAATALTMLASKL
jgi:hypothetical protein